MQLAFDLIIILAYSLTSTLSSTTTENCFLRSESFKCRLGTRSPYRFIANHNDSPIQYPGCTEKKMWLIIRHGTRYPGKKYVPSLLYSLPKLKNIILNKYKENKTELTLEEASLLSTWKVPFAENDTMRLSEEGENEMIDLAERYQSRFPSLMPEAYDNQTYKFKYTNTQRTRESARHFAAGLFGWHNSQHILYPQPEDKDPILRFYKRCERWASDVHNNPEAQKEKELFVNSDVFLNALNTMSKRVGYEVNYKDARLMHMMCAYETAWDEKSDSPWCRLISAETFKIFEFAEDLEYYWIDGYGYKLTYEQACAALRDMFSFFLSDSGPQVSSYFTHSGTVLKLLALLGVAKDEEPLMHNSFSHHGDTREWRTSFIDTFATNIAFVLYNCTSGGPSVLFMHQERPVFLPGCPLHQPCPMSIMKALYPDHEEECQFDSICQNQKQ